MSQQENNRASISRVKSLVDQGLWFPDSEYSVNDDNEKVKLSDITSYLLTRARRSSAALNELQSPNLQDKCRGAMIGAAVGDALGTTIEFTTPGSFEPVTDITGGGPFHLLAGEWTDDSSMMLCLAHSILRTQRFTLTDQIELYLKWRNEGAFSVTATCFDIGNTVSQALNNYVDDGNPEAGPTDRFSAGNGSLMRLAPVPIFYNRDFAAAVEQSGLSSKTTHGAEEAVDACRYFGGLIWGALNGASKEELLSGLYDPLGGYWQANPLCDSIRDLTTSQQYKTKSASEVRGSGYVMHSLEAVLWAFSTTDNFAEGLLKAVNLGEDADTTGCIYGQLAGAYYGEPRIPYRWINKISHRETFYLFADDLVMTG